MYNWENTVNMVGLDLMRTLEITRVCVSEIFHHAVYNRVYETLVEKSHGGGCLSLLNHLADWYGGNVGDFTGIWDIGQKIQLVYGDV